VPPPAFVEEVLRFDPPVQYTRRVGYDTSVGGVPVSGRTGLMIVLGRGTGTRGGSPPFPRMLNRFPDIAPAGEPDRRDRLIYGKPLFSLQKYRFRLAEAKTHAVVARGPDPGSPGVPVQGAIVATRRPSARIWPCSRPVPPTCRLTRTIRATGLTSCSGTRGRPWSWSPQTRRTCLTSTGHATLFAAGTSYRVLRVDPPTSDAGRLRVFLRGLAISGQPDDATRARHGPSASTTAACHSARPHRATEADHALPRRDNARGEPTPAAGSRTR
jgi:hypothetical protein